MDKVLYAQTFHAEDAHWWFTALHELVQGIVSDYFNSREKTPLKILDAGCGTGKLMTRLAPYGDITGFDASEEAMHFCRQRNLKNVSLQDLNNWTPEKNTYDVILSIDVLYHRSIQDDKLILEKFYTALKPGGMLILNLPAFECLKRNHDVTDYGARRYRRGPLVEALKKIGFGVILRSYRLSYLFLPVFLKSVLERAKNFSAPSSELEVGQSFFSKTADFVLLQLNRIENRILRKINLPFGVSLFVVAKK